MGEERRLRGRNAAMAITRLLTAEDLQALPDDGCGYELVRGELLRMSPPGRRQGRPATRFARYLDTHVDDHERGEVYGGDRFHPRPRPGYRPCAGCELRPR
ncbi:MAG: Uma2 family endonuclease [Dehalococcoidia bacterium]